MADTLELNRIQNFYGGITVNDKDKAVGVCSNIEEMDIFSNLDFMEPNTIFGTDSDIARKITGYTLGDMNDITVGGTLYALGRDASATPLAQIWRKTSASGTSPAAWSVIKTSALTSNAQSPIAHHRVTVDVSTLTAAANVASLVTTTGHGLATNSVIPIIVAGADQTAYNGIFRGTVVNSTTISYTMTSSPVSPATELLSGQITVSFAFLYYVTGTQQLTRAEITDASSPAQFTESTNDLASTPNSMVLSGLGAANDRIPMIRYNGEQFIGHGRYVAKISTDGICTPYALTLPAGWQVVSFAPYLHNMAILARSEATGGNYSKVFYWDLSNTTGAVDETIISMGGPQIIINWYETLWGACAINGWLNIYRFSDKQATLVHQIDNIATETNTQAIIPDATKFVNDNAFYFGLYKTDKSGLYAVGQVEPGRPYAFALMKRFATTDYSSHIPRAATCVSDNWYASFSDNGTETSVKGEGTSQTRSSNAVYETVLLDLGKPETPKDWPGFLLGTKPLPTGCSIVVDAKTDNAADYDTNSDFTLTPSNDQADNGITADTFWYRTWTSLYGRAIKIRMAFTSSGTSRATVYWLSFFSRDNTIV